MSATLATYHFGRSERSLFSEIYFPKRAAYMGAIFNALRYGYEINLVKKYLIEQARDLLKEFSVYPWLFDPYNYTTTKRSKPRPSIEEALRRIEMYQSPFYGWSAYSVDGVFFDRNGKMYEEATQVVRVMFRFQSSFTEQAEKAGCGDVLRAILFWAIGQQGRLDEHKLWSPAEQRHFIARRGPWTKRKRDFIERYFAGVAKETAKWIDDRALFIFAYLVRKFSDNVLVEQLYEDEIWVTSLFTQVLNVVKRKEPKS